MVNLAFQFKSWQSLSKLFNSNITSHSYLNKQAIIFSFFS